MKHKQPHMSNIVTITVAMTKHADTDVAKFKYWIIKLGNYIWKSLMQPSQQDYKSAGN